MREPPYHGDDVDGFVSADTSHSVVAIVSIDPRVIPSPTPDEDTGVCWCAQWLIGISVTRRKTEGVSVVARDFRLLIPTEGAVPLRTDRMSSLALQADVISGNDGLPASGIWRWGGFEERSDQHGSVGILHGFPLTPRRFAVLLIRMYP